MRSVYTRLKDQFPYSRFEVYDPEKRWDTYTTHGSEVYGEGNEAAIGTFGVIRKRVAVSMGEDAEACQITVEG